MHLNVLYLFSSGKIIESTFHYRLTNQTDFHHGLLAEGDDQTELSRQILQRNGAESIDHAREQWWVGLRDAEKEHYSQEGQDFARDEKEYRLGFEAALHLPTRGSSYEQGESYLKSLYPDTYQRDAFRRGYDRGQIYCQTLGVAPIKQQRKN